ncbi:hypothetical protein BDR22DRAFT_222639 [Usnea florida]
MRYSSCPWEYIYQLLPHTYPHKFSTISKIISNSIPLNINLAQANGQQFPILVIKSIFDTIHPYQSQYQPPSINHTIVNMKFSSAAVTVAAISLLSTTHAAPLSFTNGEISGRLHHRRGSDLSDLSTEHSVANSFMDDLDVGFEPGATLLLPRILNFFKRQTSTSPSSLTEASSPQDSSTENTETAGTTDQDAHTEVMSPDYESYGFASEGGPDTALTAIREKA